VREDFGLPRLPHDVRHVYTDADFVLYADMEELYPTRGLPGNHRFIGPVVWQPTAALPGSLPARPAGRPLIYVALGSSGPAELLPAIVDVLERLQVAAIVATAGRTNVESRSGDIRVMPFVAGTDAAQLSDLVICNGGSLGCFQALSAGVPVIGIPSNMDQFLNMRAIEEAKAGIVLRADRLEANSIRSVVQRLMFVENFRKTASRLAQYHLPEAAPKRFADFIHKDGERPPVDDTL
jgi:UDP:flavonoid glycosyltransferase YjiC (YdhE family)